MRRGDIHSVVNLSLLLAVEAAVLYSFFAFLDIAAVFKWIASPFIFLAVAYAFHRLGPKATGPVIDRVFKHIDY